MGKGHAHIRISICSRAHPFPDEILMAPLLRLVLVPVLISMAPEPEYLLPSVSPTNVNMRYEHENEQH